jgi:hypothetical protein
MNRLKVFVLLLMVAMSAHADPWNRFDHPPGFYRHEPRIWAGGNWYQGNYMGRPGWYWVVGGNYYYYPRPIYPYPTPYIAPTVVVPVTMPAPVTTPIKLESQPQGQVWYFCESANAYYPYVSECNGEWKTMPAIPPAPAHKP